MVIIHIYVGTVADLDSQCGRAGDTGGQKYQQTIYISRVCVGVRAFLRGGGGTTNRGWYVQYIWNTQNLERLGRGTGIRSAQNIPGQMDRGEFQKNKPTKRIYMHGYSGYKMVATEAPITHSGGVAILYRAEENFSVESLHTYGPNVVSFHCLPPALS